MTRFVALLRGVNVGRGNRVPMAALRELLSSLGYADVKTLLNSGNAVFASSRKAAAGHATAIRKALVRELGIDVPVIVKSQRELDAVVSSNKLEKTADDHSRLLVALTDDEAALGSLTVLQSLVRPPEAFFIGEHAAYLWCPNGILKSKAADALLGKAGRSFTTRNWATVLKLAALVRNESADASPRRAQRKRETAARRKQSAR